jgi:L-asparaginase / beta-aspartyl-peptidase
MSSNLIHRILAMSFSFLETSRAITVCAMLSSIMMVVATIADAQVQSDVNTSDEGKQTIVNIESILAAQTDAWNQGDIDKFMQTYWKSEELTFSSSGKTTRGWDSTLRRYKEKYSSRELMGKLTFSELEVTLLNDSAALVLGRWHLDRPDVREGPTELEGNFSLVLRKLDDRWLIIHDHSSLEPEEASKNE